MTLNFTQLESLLESLTEIQNIKMSFKLSMLFAKNISLLRKEEEFFIQQEQEFARKFLKFDSDKQEFVQIEPNKFIINEGMEAECAEARKELDNFTVEVDLRMIPISLIENMEFTPKQLAGLEMLITEEE